MRTTPWLSPADEQKAFKLPAGFEINLVAAEPDIQKPLNMAFDERGRIWLTCTVEYPYAAPPDRLAKDSIRVLEDTDGDGRFETVTTFADGLNIPIGIYPYKGGCIAYSIPNIWHLEDTDGDGVCDKRTILYGPFDYSRDTHGMVNSFRRGFDGWIYACHGFNNDSHVKGRDGNEVHMQSGNTFRFKLDGSRIEHFTHGQVNPFGMCFDELFNIFTADCHSKPLTQLIRGGYCPSFGKPHDGLGFVPSMMEHSHGSTAICGVTIYTGENFPAEYRGLFYSGNVMTSRINCNKPEYHGSTIKAIEQPDFLSTSDPWFRPVDIHIGPDGAMYILDFYNRIIGHYEVPLPHPGRDRTSGRIWRVAYAGGRKSEVGDQKSAGGALGNAVRGVPGGGKDLTKLTIPQLIDQLDSPQVEHRLRVQHWLADVVGKSCLEEVDHKLNGATKVTNALVHLLWVRERLKDGQGGDIEHGRILKALPRGSRALSVHIRKMFSEREGLFLEAGILHDSFEPDQKDGFVARAGADALAQHPHWSAIRWLLDAQKVAPEDDVLLASALKIALRNHLAVAGDQEPDWRGELKVTAEELQRLIPLCLAIRSSTAASLILDHLAATSAPPDKLVDYAKHAAQFAPPDRVQAFVELAKAKFATEIALQAQLLISFQAGLAIKDNGVPNSGLSVWGEQVAADLLQPASLLTMSWTSVPIDGLPPSENPWVVAVRPSNDGDKDSLFFYSLPKGEQRTGIYRSATFELPAKLSFWCAGHSGSPGQPMNKGNYVRLRDAKTHEVLAVSRPPRNDTARRFEWDLTKYVDDGAKPSPQPSPKGRGVRHGYIELVDGDTANAYAWLAAGRFSLPALNPGQTSSRQQLAAEIVGKLKLAALRPQLTALVSTANTDGTARTAIAQALVALEPDARAAALAVALNDLSIPEELRPRIGSAIAVRGANEYTENLREVMKRAPAKLQAMLADALVGDAAGAVALLALIESGHAAPRLLLLPNVANKLGALKDAVLDKRAAELTAKLPPASETIDKLLVERRRAFAQATPSLERGQAAFTKHCAGCHQIAGKGAVVGPQLDGIGGRGLDRLLEDTLDPNRNVDVAFRTTTIRTKDGQVLTGLVRREEGPQIVLADAQGKEFTVAKTEIDAQQKTALSLMPANAAEVVPAEEFVDLLAYLLAQRPR